MFLIAVYRRSIVRLHSLFSVLLRTHYIRRVIATHIIAYALATHRSPFAPH